MKNLIIACAFAVLIGGAAQAETIRVCPAGSEASGCRFTGDGSLQAAVDAAADGDTIIIAAGRYVPRTTRDVPFEDIKARGYVAISDKTLSLRGEKGAIIDGGDGVPAIAFVLSNADVQIADLQIENFRWGEEEDDIYDGHGIFAIDSRLRADRIVMRRIAKMGLTGRGRSLIDVTDLRLLDGHLGLWLEESSHAHVRDSVIARGDSAAVAAYDEATLHLFDSVIAGNGDDGLYATGNATIHAERSIIASNRPYGINAEENGRVRIAASLLHGNATDARPIPPGRLVIADDVIREDPMLGDDWRPRAGSPLSRSTTDRPAVGLSGPGQ